MAHSIEIRQKAMSYWDRCNDINEVINAYSISRDTLYRWKRLQKETGSLSPLTKGTEPRNIDRTKLKAYIEKHPDAYLSEIAEHLDCSTSGVFYALKALGMTHKKRPPNTKNKIL